MAFASVDVTFASEDVTSASEVVASQWPKTSKNEAFAPSTMANGQKDVMFTQYRETGTTAWLNGPICTQMRNIPVPLLIPGKTYDFRIQFYGGSTGQSDWSDVVSHMVT
jgi:hypothetical protein